MDLIFLILIFLALGFLLGSSSLIRKADRGKVKYVDKSKRFSDRIEESWIRFVKPSNYAEQFRTWVTEANRSLFPDDFTRWVSGLSENELQAYVKSLTDYSNGLGFNLHKLVRGDLDCDPRLRQVFVEAITVYSSAYRKAKQAKEDLDRAISDSDLKKSENESEAGGDGKTEKSNRRSKEMVEAASTD